MAAAAGRKVISIHDYPEHLNPFREDDSHKLKFWTLGRSRLTRSNSINFSGIKDLKNSWAFRSFMRKGKKGSETSSKNKPTKVNGQTSPIVYRRGLQYSSGSGARSTVPTGSPERPERYVYGGSVTPLPRSRFQERLRSTSQQEVSMLDTPHMARSEISGSRLSVESSNPFDECPVPPVRASRRKKKRAPAPPAVPDGDVPVNGDISELQITETGVKKKVTTNNTDDSELEEMNLTVELKIVEDDEDNKRVQATVSSPSSDKKETVEVTLAASPKPNNIGIQSEEGGRKATELNKKIESDKTKKETHSENKIKAAESDEDILNSVPFPKVDVVKYRRNSSMNEDDIRLRRGNLEDFHVLSNKRSKSLTDTSDPNYVTYDINLNENPATDKNGNEEPQKVTCKLYTETARKQSIDNSISSTEKEFLEIDKVRKEFEKEINKLNAALAEDDFSSTAPGSRVSVSDMKRKFDKTDISVPNPIPKPRRSHYSESSSPVNGNIETLT